MYDVQWLHYTDDKPNPEILNIFYYPFGFSPKLQIKFFCFFTEYFAGPLFVKDGTCLTSFGV